MAVGDEKVRVEAGEVEVEGAGALGGVDEGEDGQLAAGADERLVGDADSRDGGQGVEEGEAGSAAVAAGCGDGGAEGGEVGGVGEGVGEGDGAGLDEPPAGVGDVGDGLLAGAVGGGEVEDLVAAVGVPGLGEGAEDGVDADGGVGDEDELVEVGRAEELGGGAAVVVEELGVGVADELVGPALVEVLVVVEPLLDEGGGGAVGSWCSRQREEELGGLGAVPWLRLWYAGSIKNSLRTSLPKARGNEGSVSVSVPFSVSGCSVL